MTIDNESGCLAVLLLLVTLNLITHCHSNFLHSVNDIAEMFINCITTRHEIHDKFEYCTLKYFSPRIIGPNGFAFWEHLTKFPI